MTTLQMTVLRIHHSPSDAPSLVRHLFQRMGASLRGHRAPEWYMLNDRLLRDIGASPYDAELERLAARHGVSDWLEPGRRRACLIRQL